MWPLQRLYCKNTHRTGHAKYTTIHKVLPLSIVLQKLVIFQILLLKLLLNTVKCKIHKVLLPRTVNVMLTKILPLRPLLRQQLQHLLQLLPLLRWNDMNTAISAVILFTIISCFKRLNIIIMNIIKDMFCVPHCNVVEHVVKRTAFMSCVHLNHFMICFHHYR